MEANELRIGNYVTDRAGKLLKIDWWESINKACMNIEVNGIKVHPMTENVEYCEPIPLTEEWLLKFENVKWINKDIHGIFYWFNGCKKYIKFVHSFQNTYFCIEQKEILCKD